MKRRFWTGLFCLLLAMLCLLALAACQTPDGDGEGDSCTHGSMTWIDEVAASCTATGTVGHWHCADCGKNFDEDKVEIDSLTIPYAHNPGSEWLTENDKHYHACLNGCGTKLDETSCFGDLHHDDTGHWIVCEVCGKSTAKLSHDHTANTVTSLATCIEGGYTTYYCICGHTYIDNETAAADHQYAEAWEHNDSYHWHAAICGCADERSQYERHTYTAVVTAPGCETQGYTTYTCKCGDSYVSDYVAATGHAVSEWTETESTLFDASKCEYSVSYAGTCSTCHTEQTKTEQVERHSFFDRVTVGATCKDSGFKGTFCSNEKCKYHTNAYKNLPYSDPDAHVWVEDPANSDPEKGITAYKCGEQGCHATKKISTGTSAGVSKEELGNVSEVELKDATIGIEEIKNAIGQKDVSISAGVVEGENRDAVINDANLSKEQKELLGDGKIYNFTIMENGGGEIGNFGEDKATVRIRYDLKPTDDPNHILVWYISEGELTAIEAVYSEDADGYGYVTFRTNHFSYYTVVHVSPELLCEKLNKHDERHLHVVEPTCTTEGYTVCLRCGKEVEGSREAALGHTMNETVIAEATCATYGVTRHSCADCGLSYEAVTPALGHYYVITEQVGATCKQAGHVTYRCAHCGDSYTESIRKLAHVYHTAVVEPTCTEGGYTEKTCTQCGEVSTSRHTPAVGHTEGSVWYKNESEHYHICTACGEKMSVATHVPGPAATEQTAQICTVCEYTLAAPIVHTHRLSRVAEVKATCTASGNIEYYTCDCGAWFGDASAKMPITDHAAVIVDAKGHTPTPTAYLEPTCESVGYTAGVWCDVCKTYLRGHIEISAYGHDYAERTTAPTCTAKGSVTYVCAHCGDADETNARELPALGHNTVSVVTAPTCTEQGYTTHTCLRCKAQTVDTYTAALDHKYATAYQSDENGHWHACTRCKATTDAVAHTPDHQEATTAHGIKCVQCSYVLADAIAHTHATVESVAATNPTCTASGNIAYYVCSCDEWFYDAACTQPIYDRASVLLKPIGHILTYHADQKATCTAVGYTSGAYCTGCQTWLTGHEEIPMLDHVYSKVYLNNEQSHWHKCETCDATAEVEAHRYAMLVTAPTCQNGGYTTYTCTACGYSYVGDRTEAVEHVFENGKCKWCGMAEPVKPVDPTNPTVLYRWEQDVGNGEKMVYLFYSNGELIATYRGETMTAYWAEKDGMVFLYEDAAHTSFVGKATINADGTVTPYVCKEHNYVLVIDRAPTCTEPGETWYQCTECGEGHGDGTGPLGHHYVNGKCDRCGEPDNGETPDMPGDSDLEKQRAEILSRMEKDWKNVASSPTIEKTYRTQYEMLREKVQKATSMDEIHSIYNGSFMEMIKRIMEQGGYPGGSEARVVYTYEQIFPESGRKLLYRFYENGEVRVEYDGMTTVLYWVDENGTVAVYMNPDRSDFEERFVVNEKGELERYVCEGEHEMELVASREPNCWEDGYTIYICRACGHQVTETEPAVDHEYSNGYCKWCGESEHKDPSETVCYTYFYQVTDATGRVSKVEMTFYMDGKVVVYENDLMWIYYWIDRNGVITVYEDEEMSLRFGCFQADKDGKLSVYTCPGEHAYERMDYRDPTCMDGGYESYVCSVCGHSDYQYSDPVEHEFHDGMCIWCGESNLPEDDTPALPDGIEYSYKYINRYVESDGTVCHEIYLFFNDGTVDARLYENGELGMQVVCYWVNDGRLVRMYFDEDYTKIIDAYTIGDDGTTLTLWECKEHKYKVIESIAPTCTAGGYTTKMCTDCGDTTTDYTEPLGHAYDESGVCGRCGASAGGETPSDPTVRYVYETEITDGEGNAIGKMIYTFYSNGTVSGKYSTVNITMYWTEQDGIVTMYRDVKHTEITGKLIVGEDGSLSIYDCHGKHVYETAYEQGATCLKEGHKLLVCQWCGDQHEEIIPALGHQYNDSGICERCGASGGEAPADPNLDKYREEVLSLMQREWLVALPSASVEEMYRNQYDMICEMIVSAESLEDIQWIYENQFKMLLEKIRQENDDPNLPDGPSVPEDSTVVYTWERVSADGLKLVYKFYSNGEMHADAYGMTMVFYWAEADGIVSVYEDRDHTSLIAKATVNEDHTLTPYICPDGKHHYETVIQRDPTCTEGGYEEYRCTECGETDSKSSEPFGHAYDENGVCGRCGASEGGDPSDMLEPFRKDILAQMKKDWTEAIPNAEVEAKYQSQYEELCQMVRQSGTIDEIQNIYNGPFCELIDKVRKSAGEDAWIESIEVPFEMPEVEAGADVEMFLGANVINRVIYVYYNDKTITRIPITRDMIDTMGQDFSKGGSTVTFRICYKDFETFVEINVLNGCMHDNSTVERKEATCTAAGYERIFCPDCNEQISYKPLSMIPHSYVDGKCEWCGVGSDDTLEQTRQELYASMKAEWEKLLASGIAITDAQQQCFDELIAQINAATNASVIKRIYQKDFRELVALVHSGMDPEQPGDGCTHEKTIRDFFAATCTEDGYERYYCAECDEETSYTTIFALGHSFIGGKCEWCGEIEESGGADAELEAFKSEILAQMTTEYHELLGKYEVTESFRTQIDNLFARVQSATDTKTVTTLYERSFRTLVDKIVQNCPPSEEEPKPELELIYETDMYDANGNVIKFRFYSECILIITRDNKTQTQYWIERDDGHIDVYSDESFNDLVGRFEVTGDGQILPVTCTEHELALIGQTDPTCTESGCLNYQCIKCGISEPTYIPPLGHHYDETGFCTRCGEGGDVEEPSKDIEILRKQIMEMMSEEWSWLRQEYNVSSEYETSYKMLHQSIRMAQTEEALWEIFDCEFMALREMIEANCERNDESGDDEFDNAVIDVALPFETNLSVVVGTDMEKFLEEYLMGQNILLYLADGTTKTLTVTRDMIETFGAGFDEVGDFVELEITYPVDGGNRSCYVYVSVQADFENAKFLGKYVYQQDGGALLFELYDNGYARVTMSSGDYSDTTSMAYELKDGLLYVEMNGAKMVLVPYENGVAEMYRPEGDPFATYTYEGVTVSVYGKYTVAGEYIAVAYDEYQTMTVEITLDREAGTVWIPMFSDGALSIGKDNELYCNHSFEIIHKEEATCEKGGYYYEECVYCGENNGTDTPALGHSYDASGACMNCGRYSDDGKDDDFIIDIPGANNPESGGNNDYVVVGPTAPENGGSGNDYIITDPTYSEDGTLGDLTFDYVA